MSRKIISSVAVLAAAAVLSAGASAPVASAAPAKPAGKAQGAKKVSGKKNSRRSEGRGTRTVRPPRGGVIRIKASPTGNGPANAAECNRFAADIDTATVALEDYLLEGMDDEAQGMSDAINELEATGTKRGCSFSS